MNTELVQTRFPVGQVARLAPLNADTVGRMRQEVLAAPTKGVVAYAAYQSGGWWTASLLNHSGDPEDAVIGDGKPIPTTLMKQMPVTAKFLSDLGLNYMYVRVARLAPHSYLWEHRDYTELDAVPRYRLHIPLVTNPSAVLVTAGTRIHMRTGWLWRLTPTVAHGVCNTNGPDRIHLIADVYADDAYNALADGPQLDSSDATTLTELTAAERETFLIQAHELARLGFTGAAEQHLLRLYYQHDLPEGGAYDLIATLHDNLGNPETAAQWRRDKDYLLART